MANVALYTFGLIDPAAFLKGPWPGHVPWSVDDGTVPNWSDGVAKLEALAREGETNGYFTFGAFRPRP